MRKTPKVPHVLRPGVDDDGRFTCAFCGHAWDTARQARRGSCPARPTGDLVALREWLDAYVLREVVVARRQGVSWDRIAARLGTTRQSAHERFSGVVDAQG